MHKDMDEPIIEFQKFMSDLGVASTQNHIRSIRKANEAIASNSISEVRRLFGDDVPADQLRSAIMLDYEDGIERFLSSDETGTARKVRESRIVPTFNINMHNKSLKNVANWLQDNPDTTGEIPKDLMALLAQYKTMTAPEVKFELGELLLSDDDPETTALGAYVLGTAWVGMQSMKLMFLNRNEIETHEAQANPFTKPMLDNIEYVKKLLDDSENSFDL